MLSLPPSVRIFLCLEPTDMRRGFDTLAHMAREIFEQDPLSGHLFVFRGRQGQRLKILYWDGDGLAIWYKRPVLGAGGRIIGGVDCDYVKVIGIWRNAGKWAALRKEQRNDFVRCSKG